jgi:ArsR family transcriptional regulator, arsenate/arsenite/antimonite-responsive transcriptional repressor
LRKAYSRALPSEWQAMARVFTALGDPHRQRIVLMFGKGERLRAGDIAGASTLSRPAVSHHLKILRQAGVLESEKLGTEVYFWINKRLLVGTFSSVLEYVRAEA